MLNIHKKNISSIVVVLILMLVTITSIIEFNSWFKTYQEKISLKNEKTDMTDFNTNIETVIGNSLYVKAINGLNITKLMIDKQECDFKGYIDGTEQIDIYDCIKNNSKDSISEILIVSDKGLLTKYVYIKNTCTINNNQTTEENLTQPYPKIGGYLYLSNRHSTVSLPSPSWIGDNEENLSISTSTVYYTTVSGSNIISPFSSRINMTIYAHHMCWNNDQSFLNISLHRSDDGVDGYLYFSKDGSSYSGRTIIVKNGTTIVNTNAQFGSYSGMIYGYLDFNGGTLTFRPIGSYGQTLKNIPYNSSNVSYIKVSGSAMTSYSGGACGSDVSIRVNEPTSDSNPWDKEYPETGGYIYMANRQGYTDMPNEAWIGNNSDNLIAVSYSTSGNTASGSNLIIPFKTTLNLSVFASHMCWSGDQSTIRINFFRKDGTLDGYYYFLKGGSSYTGRTIIVKNGVTLIDTTSYFGSYGGQINGYISFSNNLFTYTPLGSFGQTSKSVSYNFSDVAYLEVSGSAMTTYSGGSCGSWAYLRVEKPTDN